ncbi:unnamed protein product, partial [Linum tenue]
MRFNWNLNSGSVQIAQSFFVVCLRELYKITRLMVLKVE